MYNRENIIEKLKEVVRFCKDNKCLKNITDEDYCNMLEIIGTILED